METFLKYWCFQIFLQFGDRTSSKDKSEVGMIDDKIQDNTAMQGRREVDWAPGLGAEDALRC